MVKGSELGRLPPVLPCRSFLSDGLAAQVGVDGLNAALELPISERQAAARVRESLATICQNPA